jgi:glutathione S-transferase
MSTCTRKVLTTLAEKGHEAEFVLLDFAKGEHKQPAHLARQPFGVMPAFEDDGFMLYESRAIIRYLNDKLPGASLVPSDIQARARMEQFISVEQSYFSPGAMKIVMQVMFGKMMGKEPDMEVVKKGEDEVNRVFDVVDKTLASQPYLAGDTFSLADICWMPYVQYLFPSGAGSLVTERSNVGAWWQRASTRPSWVKVAG